MKNQADFGGCHPPWPLASVDNTLLHLLNSSYPTQPHSLIANNKLNLMWKIMHVFCGQCFYSKPSNKWHPKVLLKLIKVLLIYLFFTNHSSLSLTVVPLCLCPPWLILAICRQKQTSCMSIVNQVFECEYVKSQ